MELATVGLRALLPKLAHLLQDEYNLHKGAREDVHFLSKVLEAILYAISEAGELPLDQLSDLVRLWAREVRELSYDAEDIVDTFMVRIQLDPEPPSESSAKGLIKKVFSKVNILDTKPTARREITKEIKGIKERLREVAEKRDRYMKIDYIAPTNNYTRLDPRVATLFPNVAELVGIEEAKEEVIKILTEGYGGERIRIVSIAGSGGLGKTTLAKVVYDEIRRDFDCTAFVSVSRNPDQKKLLKDILYKLDNDKFGDDYHTATLNERQLIELVREFLHIKRYLIVIDDIWDIASWKVIRIALIENNMRSVIITTSRNIDVAEQAGRCYRLKPLSSESSEILFYRRIFGSEGKCPVQILELSKKILKKCGGIPIAIITTAGLLATKSEDIKVWSDVCDSIGSGLGRNPGMDVMRKILLLSYDDLPSHLKICLLYLSIFPEHYEIPKNQLIWRWVAEGFVQRDKQAQDQISFFKIGESYFNQLLNRSLIQPANMDMGGTPLACRVHDTVLDLVVSLSREESFITTVLGDGKHSLDINQVRWLSLHSSHNTTWSATNMPKLRSLTIFESDSMFEPDGVVTNPTPYLPHYHLLRVLDLREFKLKNLASLGFLGSLSHLRYLGLSTNSVYECDRDNPDQLPVEIGKLRFLQTLDISQTGVEELPSSIVEVRQLICLRGSDAEVTRLPRRLKNLTSLETLERVVVTTECIAEELGHLTQLRVLDVSTRSLNKDRVEDKHDHLRACDQALVESIGKLMKIESLRIGHSPFDSGCCLDGSMEVPLYNLHRLHIHTILAVPTWIRPALLPCLSYLDINVDYERRDDIQVLGMLPCLRHLKFVANCLKEEPMERCEVGPDAFPCVVSCEFRTNRRGGVVPSVFPPGAMPMLKDLTLRFWLEDFCGGGDGALYTVDDLGLGHLPSLRSVNVYSFFHLSDNKAIVNDKVITSMKMKKKLRHEAAVHPNHPLRLDVDVVPVSSASA
ncbi:unnamed protein product [Urochloa humidicola]